MTLFSISTMKRKQNWAALPKIMQITLSSIVALFSIGWCSHVSAGSYEAICGSMECRIAVSPEKIVTPYGVIPTTRVANWGGSGTSSTDLVFGAAATYILGPAGLFGFLAKNHDYNYAITGYDQEGNRLSVRIRFLNSKPAKEFVEEMVEATGLGMGQTRTASQIKELEAQLRDSNSQERKRLKSQTLDGDYALEMNKHGSHTSSIREESGNNCWSTHLKSRPDIAKWAEANRAASKRLKKNFGNC